MTTTNWRRALVVRDHEEDLWARTSHGWHYLGDQADLCVTTGELEEYEPVPVLFGAGAPPVCSVGDLTARHVGARVRVQGVGGVLSRLQATDEEVLLWIVGLPDIVEAATGTPCEVLE